MKLLRMKLKNQKMIIQKETDKFIKEVDKMIETKEKEIMVV